MKKFIILLLITFAVGNLPIFFTGTSTDGLILPSLYPPNILFPIVWSILFILITIAIYRVSKVDDDSYVIYFVQLIVNALWNVFFFGLKWRLFAFIWLVFLFALILIMILRFRKLDKTSIYLLAPYAVWVLFAGYLNLAIYLLNR